MEYDLSGENGNVFKIVGFVRGALLKDNQRDKANEWTQRVHEMMNNDCDYEDILSLAETYIVGLSFIR